MQELSDTFRGSKCSEGEAGEDGLIKGGATTRLLQQVKS